MITRPSLALLACSKACARKFRPSTTGQVPKRTAGIGRVTSQAARVAKSSATAGPTTSMAKAMSATEPAPISLQLETAAATGSEGVEIQAEDLDRLLICGFWSTMRAWCRHETSSALRTCHSCDGARERWTPGVSPLSTQSRLAYCA